MGRVHHLPLPRPSHALLTSLSLRISLGFFRTLLLSSTSSFNMPVPRWYTPILLRKPASCEAEVVYDSEPEREVSSHEQQLRKIMRKTQSTAVQQTVIELSSDTEPDDIQSSRNIVTVVEVPGTYLIYHTVSTLSQRPLDSSLAPEIAQTSSKSTSAVDLAVKPTSVAQPQRASTKGALETARTPRSS